MSPLDGQESLVGTARYAGVRDDRVLAALATVPRDWFTPPNTAAQAGVDQPIPIGHGQTTSQPSLIARILEDLRIRPGNNVLEVGAGLGYEAALATVLASPGGSVLTIERDARLAAEARQRLERLGEVLGDVPWDVQVRTGDGSKGAPDVAPFDAIVVAATCSEVPRALLDQLAEDGRLIAPVEGPEGTRLLRYEREGDHVAVAGDLGFVRYVPLLPGVTGERPPNGRSSGNGLHSGPDTRA